MQQLLAQDRVRIIGVCFGHQIVGRAMGVKVGRSNRGWEASVCEVDLTARGKELFGKDKLVRLQSLILSLPTAHHYQHICNAASVSLSFSAACYGC